MKSEFFAAVATFGVLNTICSILKMLGAFPQCEKKKVENSEVPPVALLAFCCKTLEVFFL